jgi:hypothetical protein
MASQRLRQWCALKVPASLRLPAYAPNTNS